MGRTETITRALPAQTPGEPGRARTWAVRCWAGWGRLSTSVGAIIVSTALLGACGSGGSTSTQSVRPASGQSAANQSSTGSAGVVRASIGAVTATMHASSHHPHVNQPWPVSFTVSRHGAPAKAEVRYQYLFGGQVVGRRSHYRFSGSFHDVFMWPSSAVGYPLTLRAVVTSGTVTLNLDYPVQVIP